MDTKRPPESWETPSLESSGRVLRYTHVPTPAHPDSQNLLAVWRAREETGGMAAGRDVPSRAIAAQLHSIMVTEPMADGDFHIRIAGSALRRRYGQEVTALRLSDLFERPYHEPHQKHTRAVLETGEPCFLDVKEYELGQVRSHSEIAVLRILAPDRATHWILAGVFYFD
jgi:hypothetical protein